MRKRKDDPKPRVSTGTQKRQFKQKKDKEKVISPIPIPQKKIPFGEPPSWVEEITLIEYLARGVKGFPKVLFQNLIDFNAREREVIREKNKKKEIEECQKKLWGFDKSGNFFAHLFLVINLPEISISPPRVVRRQLL
jgi:hypothetical protein